MADLDQDLEDMMHVAMDDGNYNLKILNDAFEGRAHENEEIELVKVGDEMKIKKRTKRPPRPVTGKVGGKNNASEYFGFDANGRLSAERRDSRLEAIMEEVRQRTAGEFDAIDAQYREEEKHEKSYHDNGENTDASNCMALVPVTSDAPCDVKRRKRNRELLKMQAKALSSKDPNKAKVLYDADANDANEGSTFVTGIGIPGRAKKKQKKQQQVVQYDEEHKFYDNLEDELIDRVDQTEKEMLEMMKFLTSVEDMMGGDDLEEIRKMLETTGTSV